VATLSLYQRIITTDPATKAYDTLRIQILTPGGKVLKTLASFSNKNASGNYRLYQFSLKGFTGQTIVIKFSSAETLRKHATSFLIDNVTLKAS
jgi:xanthomonalisin